jgi:hypothetical protein
VNNGTRPTMDIGPTRCAAAKPTVPPRRSVDASLRFAGIDGLHFQDLIQDSQQHQCEDRSSAQLASNLHIASLGSGDLSNEGESQPCATVGLGCARAELHPRVARTLRSVAPGRRAAESSAKLFGNWGTANSPLDAIEHAVCAASLDREVQPTVRNQEA